MHFRNTLHIFLLAYHLKSKSWEKVFHSQQLCTPVYAFVMLWLNAYCFQQFPVDKMHSAKANLRVKWKKPLPIFYFLKPESTTHTSFLFPYCCISSSYFLNSEYSPPPLPPWESSGTPLLSQSQKKNKLQSKLLPPSAPILQTKLLKLKLWNVRTGNPTFKHCIPIIFILSRFS